MNKIAHKILLVEDDRSLRKLVTMILELEGFNVSKAENGKQAIDFLGREEVSLVILDLFMPVMDGGYVLNWMRNVAHSITPVLIFTAVMDEQTRSKMLAAGADCFINKPLDAEQIIQAVNNLLNKR